MGTRMILATIIVGACTLLVALAQESKPTPPLSDEEATKLIAGYQKCKKANEKPIQVYRIFSELCRSMTATEQRLFQQDLHGENYITVYVNETGREEFFEKTKPRFSAGSVIVKEKLAKPGENPDLLTVMVKRDRGYDPANGDWQFLTFDGKGAKVTSGGNVKNCQECHERRKDVDFVFRAYLSADVRLQLK